MDQKRRHERFETDIPVKLSIPGGKGKAAFEAFAKLRDVSLGGAFVLSGFRFKNSIEDLEVEIFLPTGNLPVKARVVALKLNQEGSALPSASLAEKVSVSLSASVKVAVGTVKLIAVPVVPL